jgi:hypothetical protein
MHNNPTHALFITNRIAVHNNLLIFLAGFGLLISSSLRTSYQQPPTGLPTSKSGLFFSKSVSVIGTLCTLCTGLIITAITDLTYKNLIISKWESLQETGILIPDEEV